MKEYSKSVLSFFDVFSPESNPSMLCDGMLSKVINGEVVTKPEIYNPYTFTSKWKEDLSSSELSQITTKPIRPKKLKHTFERIAYQKKVCVQGHSGFVTDYKEYIDGKTYYEYQENSNIRKSWRVIENKIKNYNSDLKEYNRLMNRYKINMSILN